MQIASINPGSYFHYLDHLGPFSALLDIPLLLVDPHLDELARRYYPGLQVQLLPWGTLEPRFLMENYDILIRSDYYGRRKVREFFGPLEREFGKKIRSVHLPHGFSDKVFWFRQAKDEDILLVYGDNMKDMLRAEGVFDAISHKVTMGNVRKQYFEEHRTFYLKLAEEEVFSQFHGKRKTILYAPSWRDTQGNSSFFEAAPKLLESLGERFNLIVKLHPHLADNDIVGLYGLMARFEKRPNIVFLQDFSPVYPLLAGVDLYLGDASSIGYDALSFLLPMFFLDYVEERPPGDKRAYLMQAGVRIPPSQHVKLLDIVEEKLPFAPQFHEIQKRIYDYSFAPLDARTVKDELLASAR